VPPGCSSRACYLRKLRRRRLRRRPVPGPGCGSRITRRPPRDSAATASAAAASSRPARNLAPMTPATELNPHKTRVEPPSGSPRRLAAPGQIKTAPSAHGPWPIGTPAGNVIVGGHAAGPELGQISAHVHEMTQSRTRYQAESPDLHFRRRPQIKRSAPLVCRGPPQRRRCR